jgi:hypothetical protein
MISLRRMLPIGRVPSARHEHADPPRAVALLRACREHRERPRYRAAEERDELAPPDAEHGLPPRQT